MWKLKLAGGLFGLLLIAGLLAWGKHGWALYHSESDKLHGLVSVVAEVDGKPKLKVKDAPAAVRRVGADRDTYYRNWQGAKSALLDQTQRVVALGEKTRRAREEADQAKALALKLTAQRDGWIKRAQAAATRTQRLSAEGEVRQCEEAIDALYQAGF